MLKTHYVFTGHPTSTICSRPVRSGTRTSTNVYSVTCAACKSNPGFVEDFEAAQIQKQAAFEAQTPRPATHLFGEPIVCGCGGTLFREADRTCHGHYANYVCANCGTTNQSITETGMSF